MNSRRRAKGRRSEKIGRSRLGLGDVRDRTTDMPLRRSRWWRSESVTGTRLLLAFAWIAWRSVTNWKSGRLRPQSCRSKSFRPQGCAVEQIARHSSAWRSNSEWQTALLAWLRFQELTRWARTGTRSFRVLERSQARPAQPEKQLAKLIAQP